MKKKNYDSMQNVLGNYPIDEAPVDGYSKMQAVLSAVSQVESTNSIDYKKNTIEKSNITVNSGPREYKYDENAFIELLQAHVDSTYQSHYGGSVQPVEFIMSNAESLDYLKGNVVKYVHRYGKKNGSNVEDLLKAVHFIMMMAKYSKE